MKDSLPGEARPRAMRADARRNYERLLAQARAVFAEHGPAASLDDIARRAGVASGTLYRHFPTREDLIEAVLRDRVEALAECGTVLLATAAPFEALEQWLRAVLDHATVYRGLSAELMTAVLDNRTIVDAWHKQMFDIGEALFDRARKRGAVRADAVSTDVLKLVGAIAWATAGAAGGTAQAERLLRLLLDGLRGSADGAGLPSTGLLDRA
jgi:AcrR family transcriptional regulator